MYAIIATGGKQYRVSEGDVIYIEKIDAQVDSTVSFDVLLMGNDGDVKIGTPVVEGVKVEGKVVGQIRGEKIVVYKYKSKKNYRRKQGQPYQGGNHQDRLRDDHHHGLYFCRRRGAWLSGQRPRGRQEDKGLRSGLLRGFRADADRRERAGSRREGDTRCRRAGRISPVRAAAGD